MGRGQLPATDVHAEKVFAFQTNTEKPRGKVVAGETSCQCPQACPLVTFLCRRFRRSLYGHTQEKLMNRLKFFDQWSGVFEILPIQLPSDAGARVTEDKVVFLQWSQHPAETQSTLPAHVVPHGGHFLSFVLMPGATAVQDALIEEIS